MIEEKINDFSWYAKRDSIMSELFNRLKYQYSQIKGLVQKIADTEICMHRLDELYKNGLALKEGPMFYVLLEIEQRHSHLNLCFDSRFHLVKPSPLTSDSTREYLQTIKTLLTYLLDKRNDKKINLPPNIANSQTAPLQHYRSLSKISNYFTLYAYNKRKMQSTNKPIVVVDAVKNNSPKYQSKNYIRNKPKIKYWLSTYKAKKYNCTNSIVSYSMADGGLFMRDGPTDTEIYHIEQKYDSNDQLIVQPISKNSSPYYLPLRSKPALKIYRYGYH